MMLQYWRKNNKVCLPNWFIYVSL